MAFVWHKLPFEAMSRNFLNLTERYAGDGAREQLPLPF